MQFNSLIFIFGFLPFVFFVNLIINKKYSNLFLAFASLLFYYWGESKYVYIFIISVILNYIFGIIMNKFENNQKLYKLIFVVGIISNLCLLVFYKYFHFLIIYINKLLLINNFTEFDNPSIHLPIGISFFTFEAIAYLSDVYTKKAKVIKNPIDLLLYMGIFPHLIAGPVIRFFDLEEQLKNRNITINDVAYGIKRFVIGLAKKVIIANGIGSIADNVFNNANNYNGSNIFLIGVVAYGLQLYFDFSGYSDMAVGLGKLFGFTFIENFNYPYASKSVQEFWRRWNISLGLWFKNYVYIPLGGSRVGNLRNLFNLFLVFLLTGLWHGAGLNFIIWGMFSGIFIILEKLFLTKLFGLLSSNISDFVSHIYLLFVIFVSWIFFRSENLDQSLNFIKKLFSFTYQDPSFLFNKESLIMFMFAIFFAFPFFRNFVKKSTNVLRNSKYTSKYNFGFKLLNNLSYICLFLISVLYVITSTYNPFIYFRF